MPTSAHYLKLEDRNGNVVEGESEGHFFDGQDYNGLIDIKEWNWGVSHQSATAGGKTAATRSATPAPAPAPAGGGAAGGETASGPQPNTFTFSKGVDKSTVRLLLAMKNGDEFPKARFTLFQELPGSERPRIDEFLLYVDLTKVRVKSYSLKGQSSEHRVDLDEDWEFDYHTIKFSYETRGVQSEFTKKPGSKTGASPRSDPSPATQAASAQREAADQAAKTQRGLNDQIEKMQREIDALKRKLG